MIHETAEAAPEVLRFGFLDCQVCVPEEWDYLAIEEFAEEVYPAGTEHGWEVRTYCNCAKPCPTKVPCDTRPGFVHVVLTV